MDLDYFRNYIMIVDSQTLTEAARRLSMVQPALSAQLKQMEHIYKTRLVITHRGGRRIELTEAGELFYRRAKDIVRIADELKHEVAHVAAGGSGTLRVAITPGAVQGFIDEYLLPFEAKYPGFRCIFNEGNVDQQADSLLSGVADIGVMNEPIPRGYLFEMIDIRYRSLLAVVPEDSDLLPRDRQELRIEHLAGVPLCVTRSVETRLNAFFRDRSLHGDIRSVCSTKSLAVHWARRGLGVGVIVGEMDEEGEGMKGFQISAEEIMSAEHIYRVKDRKLSAIAERFCKFIQNNK